jgi:hypothetical protein
MIQRPRRVGVRLNAEERKEIWAQADVSGISVSEFIRRRILGKPVASKADLRILAELRRLGGLLKHIHLETLGAYSHDTARAIRALERYAWTLEKSLRKETLEHDSQNPGQT